MELKDVVVVAVEDNFAMLRSIINILPGAHIATDSEAALKLVERYSPDIITVDAGMEENGVHLMRSLRKACPLAAMIAIAEKEGEWIMNEACDAGANAFVAKTDLQLVLPSLISSFRAGKNLQLSF